MKPTAQAYDELQLAFDHFNRELFDGQLPPCILTMQNDGRNVHGYFSPSRFTHSQEETTTDQISLNPYHFRRADPQEPAQTIAHEMCHMWQQHFGENVPRKCYHNKEFAEKMQAIGLMPSDTGKPGGKTTGQKMGDFAMPGGRFLVAYGALRKQGWRLSWYDRNADVDAAKAEAAAEDGEDGEAEAEESKNGKRVKYTCPTCETNVWGASGILINCGASECNGVAFALAPKKGKAA